MDIFIDIKTVSKNRTIDELSEVYNDFTQLRKLLSELIDENLAIEKIRGKKILLKPNWVLHSTKLKDEICLRTHNNVLFIILELVLQKSPSNVIIGDAPLQRCDWSSMLNSKFHLKIKEFARLYNVPIEIKDFRRKIFNPIENNPVTDRIPLSNYIIFDIGKASMLEPICEEGKNKFRVTDYDPERLAQSHRKGVHKYCITRDVFDSDLIISIPKIKTHQKTGITGALKNLVGINGDKDYLPHHRIGGKGFGGDCYPGKSYLRLWSELALDKANRRQGKKSFWFWTKVCSILWRLNKPYKTHHLSGAWYGNDTTWRMVMDLNKIAVFGKKDGTLSGVPQRELFNICDGIIGGQGDGPLLPDPLPLGIICFSNNSGLTDICMATLMGFDIQKIPLTAESYRLIDFNKIKLLFNGKLIQLHELKEHAVAAIPSPGWTEYLNSQIK